jgi:hypothetical protein
MEARMNPRQSRRQRAKKAKLTLPVGGKEVTWENGRELIAHDPVEALELGTVQSSPRRPFLARE